MDSSSKNMTNKPVLHSANWFTIFSSVFGKAWGRCVTWGTAKPSAAGVRRV
jgi:hypothetical protein